MEGKLFTLIVVAVLGAPAIAEAPVRLSPVLPEVTKDLEDARAEMTANTYPLARAHAMLILLKKRVPYSVSFQGVPEGRKKECMGCLDAAIAEWEKDLDGAVQFQPAEKGETTDVTVRFRPSVTMKHEQVAGYVNWTRSLKTEEDGSITPVFKADMQIRVKDLDNKDMPSCAMRHAAMHEIGHVLGLDDSPREGDVMGPLDIENPVSAPTELEIQTVRNFRDQASDILKLTRSDVETPVSESKS